LGENLWYNGRSALARRALLGSSSKPRLVACCSLARAPPRPSATQELQELRQGLPGSLVPASARPQNGLDATSAVKPRARGRRECYPAGALPRPRRHHVLRSRPRSRRRRHHLRASAASTPTIAPATTNRRAVSPRPAKGRTTRPAGDSGLSAGAIVIAARGRGCWSSRGVAWGSPSRARSSPLAVCRCALRRRAGFPAPPPPVDSPTGGGAGTVAPFRSRKHGGFSLGRWGSAVG